MKGFWLVSITYIGLIGFLMVKFSPWWFLALFLWHWKCLWEEHRLHKKDEK